MKKLKKWVSSKGGIATILITLSLVLVASFCIIVGVIYAYYNGDWSKLGELLSSEFAISIYIIIGLTVGTLVMALVLFNRTKEVE